MRSSQDFCGRFGLEVNKGAVYGTFSSVEPLTSTIFRPWRNIGNPVTTTRAGSTRQTGWRVTEAGAGRGDGPGRRPGKCSGRPAGARGPRGRRIRNNGIRHGKGATMFLLPFRGRARQTMGHAYWPMVGGAGL